MDLLWFLTFWLFFSLWLLLLLLRLRVVGKAAAGWRSVGHPRFMAAGLATIDHHWRQAYATEILCRADAAFALGRTWHEPDRYLPPHNEWFGKAFQFKLKPRNFINRAAQGSK